MKGLKKTLVTVVSLVLFSVFLSGCVSLTPTADGTLSAESVYSMAKSAGYSGSLEDFIAEFKGERGIDGIGISDVKFNSEGHLIITLTSGKEVDCGALVVNVESSDISIGENGNWYINGDDTGNRAVGEDGSSWLSGATPPPVSAGRDGDFYLDTDASDIYKKENGEWLLISSLKGETEVKDVIINSEISPNRYAAAKALLSAVSVESKFRKTSSGTMKSYSAAGAGVIYSIDREKGDAYIITNHHVVYDSECTAPDRISTDIGIYLYGMEYSSLRIPAKYIGGSLNYDIAVLKVSESDILRSSAAVAAQIADSDTVRVLDTAIAIGNPAGDGISATLGSVSVESQELEMVAHDGATTVTYRVMRIDTAVNKGNSGGGLFDEKGRLIGIVNAKEIDTTLENMGYAIPSNLAIAVADNIIANCDGATNKRMYRCSLGITIAPTNAWSDYDSESGTVIRRELCGISKILASSPLKGKLAVDDVLVGVKIGNTEYAIDYHHDFDEALINARVGDEITFYIYRNGTPMQVSVTADEACFSYVN